jgi:molecular chaperone GrpE
MSKMNNDNIERGDGAVEQDETSNPVNPTNSGEESPEELRRLLETARSEAAEQLKAWQRTQADFVNFRRRVEQERVDLVKNAEAGLIRELLPVVDDFERALNGLPPELRGLTWVEGLLLIERKLQHALELHGLQPIEALGKEFDPHEHEAVMRDGNPGDATTVVGELQRGYRLHDRVLRPTLVRVGPGQGQAANSNER